MTVSIEEGVLTRVAGVAVKRTSLGAIPVVATVRAERVTLPGQPDGSGYLIATPRHLRFVPFATDPGVPWLAKWSVVEGVDLVEGAETLLVVATSFSDDIRFRVSADAEADGAVDPPEAIVATYRDPTGTGGEAGSGASHGHGGRSRPRRHPDDGVLTELFGTPVKRTDIGTARVLHTVRADRLAVDPSRPDGAGYLVATTHHLRFVPFADDPGVAWLAKWSILEGVRPADGPHAHVLVVTASFTDEAGERFRLHDTADRGAAALAADLVATFDERVGMTSADLASEAIAAHVWPAGTHLVTVDDRDVLAVDDVPVEPDRIDLREAALLDVFDVQHVSWYSPDEAGYLAVTAAGLVYLQPTHVDVRRKWRTDWDDVRSIAVSDEVVGHDCIRVRYGDDEEKTFAIHETEVRPVDAVVDRLTSIHRSDDRSTLMPDVLVDRDGRIDLPEGADVEAALEATPVVTEATVADGTLTGVGRRRVPPTDLGGATLLALVPVVRTTTEGLYKGYLAVTTDGLQFVPRWRGDGACTVDWAQLWSVAYEPLPDSMARSVAKLAATIGGSVVLPWIGGRIARLIIDGAKPKFICLPTKTQGKLYFTSDSKRLPPATVVAILTRYQDAVAEDTKTIPPARFVPRVLVRAPEASTRPGTGRNREPTRPPVALPPLPRAVREALSLRDLRAVDDLRERAETGRISTAYYRTRVEGILSERGIDADPVALFPVDEGSTESSSPTQVSRRAVPFPSGATLAALSDAARQALANHRTLAERGLVPSAYYAGQVSRVLADAGVYDERFHQWSLLAVDTTPRGRLAEGRLVATAEGVRFVPRTVTARAWAIAWDDLSTIDAAMLPTATRMNFVRLTHDVVAESGAFVTTFGSAVTPGLRARLDEPQIRLVDVDGGVRYAGARPGGTTDTDAAVESLQQLAASGRSAAVRRHIEQAAGTATAVAAMVTAQGSRPTGGPGVWAVAGEATASAHGSPATGSEPRLPTPAACSGRDGAEAPSPVGFSAPVPGENAGDPSNRDTQPVTTSKPESASGMSDGADAEERGGRIEPSVAAEIAALTDRFERGDLDRETFERRLGSLYR